MIQLGFADSEFVQKRRITRKKCFLAKIEKLVPWRRLIDVIERHYPKRGNGRPLYPLEIMIRIDCLQLKKHPRKNRDELKLEYDKGSIRAFAEHPFRIIKCQFGFVQAVCKGLKKNDNKLATRFALANIVRLDQLIRA